jgi:SAM-dependent methyltransferase
MSGLTEQERTDTIERYAARYRQFGVSEQTLGWTHNRQMLRFSALTSLFDLRGLHVLDVGCGFGDLNRLLTERCGDDYEYTGIDLVPELISEARLLWPRPGIRFYSGDFSQLSREFSADIAVASGILNHRLTESDNYTVAESVIRDALKCCRTAVAMDFLSDRVDYQLPHTFHFDPCRILEIAYRFSRRVVLRNDYLPFEFAVVIFRDDAVDRTNGRFTVMPFERQGTT